MKKILGYLETAIVLVMIAIAVLVGARTVFAQNTQTQVPVLVTVVSGQVAGITNATNTRATITRMNTCKALDLLVNVTAGGTATGTMQLYLEDSADGGTTWDDVVSSNTFAFGAAPVTQHFFVNGYVATSATQGGAAAVETLAAGTVRSGPFGDRFHLREKVSGVAGSPVGPTYTVTLVCKS